MEHISKAVEKFNASQGRDKLLVQTSNQPPAWAGLLLSIAQSKSREMLPGEMRLWQVKLGGYSTETVEKAFLRYRGEYFPDPNTIAELCDLVQESALQERGNNDWERYKAEQRKAEQEGKLATEEDRQALRASLRKMAGLDQPSPENLEQHRKGFEAVTK
jgi:hypothetical protein